MIFAGDGNNLVFGDNGQITAAVEDGDRYGAPTSTSGLNATITIGLAETIESLSQQITQLQTTINTQTTNYQRDAEQAKTDRRVFGCLIAVIAAFGITGFCTKICFTGIYRMAALGVAGLLALGGVMFLMW